MILSVPVLFEKVLPTDYVETFPGTFVAGFLSLVPFPERNF